LFIKSTCKKFAKNSGKEGKGFAKSKDFGDLFDSSFRE
jgi:hypothetical protein